MITAVLSWILQACAHAIERLLEPCAVEGLEQIVDGIHFEGAHGVLVECRGEDDLRQGLGPGLLQQLAEYREAVETGHLHIEEDDIRLEARHQRDGFYAVLSLERRLPHHRWS